MDTTIHYSAGDSKEWAYGNQQKEFPGDENCYVRINSIPVSLELLWKYPVRSLRAFQIIKII